MTKDRVIASKLHHALEGMLYIAVHELNSSPRREDNRAEFIEAVEELLEAARTRK